MENKMTGYPHIDKPWMKYYDKDITVEYPKGNITDYVYNKSIGHEDMVDDTYYTRDFTYGESAERINHASQALRGLGVHKDDKILCMVPNMPSINQLFFGAAQIGAHLDFIDPRPDSMDMKASAKKLLEIIKRERPKYIFALDRVYLATLCLIEEELKNLGIEEIVLVSATDDMTLRGKLDYINDLVNYNKLKNIRSKGENIKQLKAIEVVLKNIKENKMINDKLKEVTAKSQLRITNYSDLLQDSKLMTFNRDNDSNQIVYTGHTSGTSGSLPKPIELSNANLIGGKVDIIASASDVPNSQAYIYIDWKKVASANVLANWSINYTVWNVDPGQHTLLIEILDLDWNTIWKSENISFSVSSDWTEWIKNVVIEPEDWLTVWDMTTITVYTDELVESVKMSLSDRSDNESIVMNKKWAGQFIQNVFLVGSWEIFLSFNISSSNNTINKSYDNYTSISVSESPSISNVKIDTNAETKTADISREAPNNTVSSYLINRRIEWSNTLSWKEWSEKNSFRFKDVPYDTIVNLNITPYWNNQSKHGAASKTIKFIISKDQKNTCWNWTCDNWESHELCPIDCEWEWWTTIILWPSCPAQSISTHTEKIWNSYYLVRDKAENVKKYIIYSSTSPDWKDKVKVYETTDTSYEYPFDHTSKEDIFMYFRVIWVCEDWEEIELTWATKVQVWPAENFFLLLCLTLLIYFWIKVFRHTED